MHSVVKTIGFLAAGLAIGFGASSWMNAQDERTSAARGTGAGELDALEQRIALLERAVHLQSGSRAELESQLADLRLLVESALDGIGDAELAGSGAAGGVALDGGRSALRPAGADRALDGGAVGPLERSRSRERFSEADIERRRLERMLQAGLAPERAQWINRRTQELRMQALNEEYRAAREGTPLDSRAMPGIDEILRGELGDADYERYLEAQGRPTSVTVRDVLGSSPAEQAGLQAGDRVVGYDGRRVFDYRDLSRLTLEGNPGETVALDVIRDGQQIQLYVPRGPIGITGGGYFDRGR